ncbi:MAG TPA: MFS transporter [Solirubrobacterales bacterium]|nr:MFS transporter [Solirubrobacterales bacterium]
MSVASFPAARHPLSRHAAYFLAAAIIGLALFASGTPSPLYGTYSELWGFDAVVLTLVYATYAFGVLATLLLAGRLSDEVGRRPVLIVAMATLAIATVPFMLADSVVWLFVARGIQGLATGLALSAASAALLDLHPNRDPVSVSLANGVASTIGMGSGVIVSAAIVQFLPAPRVLPYAVLAILFLGFLVAAWRLKEPVEVADDARFRLTPQRPYVPPEARRPFVLASLAVLSSWSIGGLFLSLGPELAAIVYKSDTHLVSGLGIFMLAISGAVSQLLFGRWAPWRGAVVGSLALAAGMGMIVAAAATTSAVLFTLGAIVTGAGFGIAFLGGLRALSSAIPPEHRAATMSAFYLVAYGSLSIPAVIAGVVVEPLGVQETFEIFGSAIILVALLVTAEAWRQRPSAQVDRRARAAIASM